MTTTTPQAPETNSQTENGLLDAYKTKEEIEKLKYFLHGPVA